jgi:protein-export membrane protein SecD
MENFAQKLFNPSRRGKIWLVFVAILALALLFGFIAGGQYYNKGSNWLANKTKNIIQLPQVKEIDFRLGLDLLGGSHLVYKADVSAVALKERNPAIEGVRDVIERRVNTFGVSEPVVTTNKNGEDYQIIVELAGIKDVNQAIKMIGETPLLEFKEQNNDKRELTSEEKKSIDDFNKQAEKKAVEVLGKAISGGDFAALAQAYSQDDASKINRGDLGWILESNNQEIYNIAKKMKPGEISKDLAKSSQGYEILKLEEKRVKKDEFNDSEIEKEVKASHLLICYEGKERCESGLTKEDAYEKIKKLKSEATAANFKDLARQNTTEPGGRERGGDLGWFGRAKMVKPFEDAVFNLKIGAISDIVETDFGYHLIFKQDERIVEELKVRRILIKIMKAEDIIGEQKDWKNTELTGKNLKRASVEFSQSSGASEVALEFDDEGAKMFADITGRNVSKPVAIFLDSYPISVPTVNEKITGGKAVITGNFNVQEAKLLAQRLTAGALPVPVSLISQETVGASLGSESVKASLIAGLAGFLLVALFMIFLYRLPGFLAVSALIIYSIIVLALFKIFSITLTLAGVAGFIMSIGMAVDANILIFARLREELANGRPFDSALEEGFKRAWPSIRDSNFFTIITCLILIFFTTSVVKGFAITLLIGVLMSMFSAIIITKNFLNLIPANWLEKRRALIGAPKMSIK